MNCSSKTTFFCLSSDYVVIHYASLPCSTQPRSSPSLFSGCLTLQDKIVNVDFFDGGMAKSSKEFVPLEELVKQPASLNRWVGMAFN